MKTKKIFIVLSLLFSLCGCEGKPSESLVSFRQYAYKKGEGLVKGKLLQEFVISYPYGHVLNYYDDSLSWFTSISDSPSEKKRKAFGLYFSLDDQSDQNKLAMDCVEEITLEKKTTNLYFGIVFKDTGENYIVTDPD